MFDGKALGEQMLTAVKEYVARSVGEAHAVVVGWMMKVSDRQDDLEDQLKKIPAGPRGEKGEPGESAYDLAIRPHSLPEEHKAWLRSLRGEKGEPGESAYQIAMRSGEERQFGAAEFAWLQSLRGENGKPGESIKGDPGQDGKSVALEEVLEALQPKMVVAVRSVVADLYVPKDGEPGMDGKDGTSVTVEDIRPLFEKELAKWELEFERRSSDLIQRCIDRIEKPKDGAPGKDGRDALDLENFDVSMSEDGRTLTLALARGESRVERIFRLHHPIYRGVYKEGDPYQRGDTVTFGGSTWNAMRDTDSKPETDDSWRLCVKRGRDGRDGAPGPRGPEGRKGKDAIRTLQPMT